LANNPLNGASIVVDFSQCADVAICQDQLDPNVLVNCAALTVRGFSDLTGTARFTILGASKGAGRATAVDACARIYANGVLLRNTRVATLDLDGANGVGISDLSVWLSDFGSGTPYARDDFDHNGVVGINDLAVWLTEFGSGRSSQSCGATCP